MVESSQWLTFLAKVVVVTGTVFLAYQILKRAIGLLVDLAFESNTSTEEPGGEPVPDVPGLHVWSEYGAEDRLVDKNPTEETIRATIRGLDWIGGFHQVFLVTSPGVSLEVGGSLDPDDGLSSAYRDLKRKIFRVVTEPPTTVENMEDLLVSFYLGDGQWERMFDNGL